MRDENHTPDQSSELEKSRAPTRRALLQAAGASLALTGVTGTGVANSNGIRNDPDEIFKRAQRIKYKTGSIEKFHDYLTNHGFTVRSSENEFAHRNGSGSDGFSIENIEEKHMTGTLTLSVYDIDEYQAYGDYTVEISSGNLNGPGTLPEDHVTISWPHSDYDLIENGAGKYNADNVVLKRSTFNGADWAFDDQMACGYGCDLMFGVTTKMKSLTPDSPPRKIQATYQSVWEDNDEGLSGFSVSSDGTVSWSSPTYDDVDYKQLDRQVVEE